MSRFRDTPLPSELAKAFGHLGSMQYKGNGEWSSECPNCGSIGHNPSSGEPDRFHMHIADKVYGARGKCRQCGHFEWADGGKHTPSAAEIKEIEAAREEQMKIEEQQLEERLQKFLASKMWEFYHDELTDRERWLWEKAGIPESFQNYWRLGYAPRYPSQQMDTDALTIPYFGEGMKASNLQYRLLKPPKIYDKYRMTKGLQSTLWLAEPDREFKGVCMLLEGAKKAAVTFIRAVADGKMHEYCVVAVPSANSYSLLDQLSGFDEVIVAFDPDQYTKKRDILGNELASPIMKVVERIDAPIVRVAKFPTKIDDFFVSHDGTLDGFKAVIDQSYQFKPRKPYKV